MSEPDQTELDMMAEEVFNKDFEELTEDEQDEVRGELEFD